LALLKSTAFLAFPNIKEIFMNRFTYALLAAISFLAMSGPVASAQRTETLAALDVSSAATEQSADSGLMQLADDSGCSECDGGDGSGGDGGDGDTAPGNSGDNAHGANDNVGLNAGGGNGGEGGDPGNSEAHNNGAVSGTHAQSSAALGTSDFEDGQPQ
jgi:hypothetical protein